jgi:hypothetical protein
MKKLLVWAMGALLTAGAAFADGRNLVAQPNATFATGAPGVAAGPTTTNNDDSCDISVAPAATLLLPYFEVELNETAATAQTTIWTITNVSALPQIAHVTVWTDWSFPVLDFNLFLTGYDVQSINMYDVIARGVIAPTSGTSSDTDPGQRSFDNDENPNFSPDAVDECAVLPGTIPASILSDLRSALTVGTYASCGSTRIGGNHANAAIGYVTIDVSSTCSTTLPTTSSYYTGEILFDNVLIGDYIQLNPDAATGNFAGGNPLVHIRATPEGGPAGTVVGTNLPYTFYDRYTPVAARQADRRQPLPSAFAARFIAGGTGNFNTDFKIWREGVTGATITCAAYGSNSALGIAESVKFDEHENPMTLAGGVVISPAPTGSVSSPETARLSSAASQFPALSTAAGDVAGWLYLNLNNGGAPSYSVAAGRVGFASGINARQSQNWVIVSMSAEGRYAVDFDAAWLGNGCTPAAPASSIDPTGSPIGPRGGTPVCPSTIVCGYTTPFTTGTNVTP